MISSYLGPCNLPMGYIKFTLDRKTILEVDSFTIPSLLKINQDLQTEIPKYFLIENVVH